MLGKLLSASALSIALVAGGAVTALAQHRDPLASAPIRGLITVLNGTNLELQTANGDVAVALVKGSTHVVRSVVASTADLTAGKQVDLHLVRGTHTVDAIRIEANRAAPAHRPPTHVPPTGTDRVPTPRDLTGATPRPSGQVVSLSGSTLTIRYGNGSTAAFTLGSKVTVNEALAGTLADLGVGETVQVVLGKPGNIARFITIISA